MATTYNNANSNVTLVKGGEINASGQVQNGYYAFSDSTVYAADFTATTPSGSADITTNPGKLTLSLDGTANTYVLGAVNRVTQNASLSSAFDFHFTMDVNFTDTNQAAGVYFNTDTNNAVRLMIFDSGLIQFRRFAGGSVTDTLTATISAAEAAAEIKLRMARDVSNNITAYYWRVGVDASWQQVGAGTITDSGSRSLAFCLQSNNTSPSATFDDLTFTSGAPINVQFKINDSGDAKIDAGALLVIDKGTVTAVTTGTLTVKEDVNDTGTFGSYGTDSAWNTPGTSGNYPHDSETGRYWWPYITMSGDGATFTSLTTDFASSDVTNPTAATNAVAYKDDETSTLDAFLKWINGTDTGGSGYAGTNIGYYDTDDSSWYYQQDDESFSTAEVFTSLNLEGTAGQESLGTLQNLPGTATQIRFTGWDAAGNHSSRTTANLIAIGGDATAPATPSLVITDNQDGTGATATISDSDDGTTNTIYTTPFGSASWMEGNNRTGDGDVDISLGAGSYWAFVESSDGSGKSYSSPVSFAVTGLGSGGGDGTPGEIRGELVSRLTSDSTLTAMLTESDAVYWQSPPRAASYPCITYVEKEDRHEEKEGSWRRQFRFSCWSDSPNMGETIASRVRTLLHNISFTTTAWQVRRCHVTAEEVITHETRNPNGVVLQEWVLTVELALFGTDESVTFALDSTSCILPAPVKTHQEYHLLSQANGFTVGGTRTVADGGVYRQQQALGFVYLTATEYDNLVSFFNTTVTGMEATFTYTDVDEVEHTVRFAESQLEITAVDKTWFHITILLEEVA